MKRIGILAAFAALGLVGSARGQEPCVPDTLLHTLADRGGLVAIAGDRAVVSAGGNTASLFDVSTGALLRTFSHPEPEAWFGAVGVSGELVAIGAMQDAPFGIDGAGAVYVFNARTGALAMTLLSPAPTKYGWLGHSVGISGNLVVAGEPFGAPQGPDNRRGAAYVFDATTRGLKATLKNPEPSTWYGFGEFGDAVAIDGNLVVVGARGHAPGINLYQAGGAFVFDATSGELLASLRDPTPSYAEAFGYSVAISGDLVWIGAPGSDDFTSYPAGTAYAFNARTGALLASVENPSPSSLNRFGFSVAVSETHAMVGAWVVGPGPDAAYIFDAATGALRATVNNPTLGGAFGYSVAISGEKAIVGAAFAGSAYIFACPTPSPSPTSTPHHQHPTPVEHSPTPAPPTPSPSPSPAISALLHRWRNPDDSAGFGSDVAASGNQAIIGTWDGRSAHVFDLSTGELALTLNHPLTNRRLGGAVALSGNRAAVGMPLDDVAGVESAGAVYLFDSQTGSFTARLTSPAPVEYAWLGSSLAMSGNRVAALETPGGLGETGMIRIFDAVTGEAKATITDPEPLSNGRFGREIALDGNVIVTGGGANSTGGKAYVFNAVTGGLVVTLENPDPLPGDGFGASVALSGNMVLVGAWGPELTPGKAHLFDASTGSLMATLNNPSPDTNQAFGHSVEISGNHILIGVESLSGAKYSIYVFDTVTRALRSEIPDPTPNGYYRFGDCMAISGDTAIVGIAPIIAYGGSGEAYAFSLPPPTPRPSLSPTPMHHDPQGTPSWHSPSPSPTPTASPSPEPGGTPFSSMNAVSDWAQYE